MSPRWKQSVVGMLKTENRAIVLVVDDSPETLGMLTEAIQQAGMTVLVAREGDDALSIVEKITPDVILMDAVMPGTDGFQTCRRLKQSAAFAHLPVIFMTGLSDTDHVIEGLEAGGVDYVTKPIVPGELLARIRVHLANARISRGARTALDVFGRFLLAANHAGRVLWCTPQASRLLASVYRDFDSDGYRLPAEAQEWMFRCATGNAATPSLHLHTDSNSVELRLVYGGRVDVDEHLLRVVEGEALNEHSILRQKLRITEREAEVLLWLARGKSNRDIAEILELSPRTVNKHLEQIYAKLGVENRASAAALAVRTIGIR